MLGLHDLRERQRPQKRALALSKLSTCCAVDRYLDCSLNTVSPDNTLPIYIHDTKHLFPDLKTTSVQSTAAQIRTNLNKDDLKPQEFNKNVAAIYRLTHIPPPSTVYVQGTGASAGFQDESASKNIFKTWGAGTTPIAENDSAMWTALNGEPFTYNTDEQISISTR